MQQYSLVLYVKTVKDAALSGYSVCSHHLACLLLSNAPEVAFHDVIVTVVRNEDAEKKKENCIEKSYGEPPFTLRYAVKLDWPAPRAV